MNTCPTCGAQYPSTVRLCTKDGTVLETAAPSDPNVGRVLDGKYRLDARLNSGGMGTVYKATHLMLGKTLAVKLINAELVTSPEIVRRFQREARAASNLNHPNIAPAYDLGQTEDGTLYIAMEFISGQSLREVIRASGQLDTARIVRILRQVASALSLAHKNDIIHRDLKPHNIMLTRDDSGREVAKLLDFGIAKTFDDATTQLTATGFALGTPQYMSPEQATGQPVDGRSDLYALGAILYEMLIGDVPFNDPSTPAVLVKQVIEPAKRPSARRPDLQISPELETIALRCLEKDPAARYQTADEFAAALEPLIGTHPTPIPSDLATVVMPQGAAAAAAAAGMGLMPTATAPAIDPAAPTMVMGDAATQTARPAVSPVRTERATPIQPPPARATVTAPPVPAASQPAHVTAPPIAAVQPPTPPAAGAGAPGHAAEARASTGRNFMAFAAMIIVLIVGVGGLALYGFGVFRWPGSTDADTTAAADTNTPAPSSPTSAAVPPAGEQPANTAGTNAGNVAASPVSGAASAPPPVAGGTAAPPPTAPAASRAGGAPASGSGGAATGSGAVPTPPPTVQPPPAPVTPPAPPPKAENPTVLFRCAGAPELCPSIRSAMEEALEKASMPAADSPDQADIVVDVRVTLESETPQTMFGQTFFVRTFSTEMMALARPRRPVRMPPPKTVSFDPRNRQLRAAEHGQLVAADIVQRLKAFWAQR